MTQDSFDSAQDQQDQQDQGLGEAAYGDSQESIDEEKAYGDSSAAVTPDTQQPPQGGGYGDATEQGDGFGGESARGESAVFEDDQKADRPTGAEPGQQDGQQSDQLAEQANVEGQTSYGQDQDAEPSQQESFEQ